MAGPRKLWKTEIVIWSEFDPQKVPPGRLVSEAEEGVAYMSKCHSEQLSNPYEQDDGPPEEFFETVCGDETGEDSRTPSTTRS